MEKNKYTFKIKQKIMENKGIIKEIMERMIKDEIEFLLEAESLIATRKEKLEAIIHASYEPLFEDK